MILINLLPPELRKRKVQLQFNPMLLALAACLLVVVGMLGGYLWLKQRRVAAEHMLVQKQLDLETVTKLADEVRKKQVEIDLFQKRHDYILSLIGQKMFWAKTIDDFATFLNQPFEGYQVCVQNLAVTESKDQPAAGRTSARNAEPSVVAYGLTWRYKIVGDEFQKSSSYFFALMKTLQDSAFWSEHGFQGKPELKYFGNKPRWNAELEKEIIENDLTWVRAKLAVPPAASTGSRAGGK